ncbi:MAG: farnesyl diphosphate synthase [Pseudomonadota bacterium]
MSEPRPPGDDHSDGKGDAAGEAFARRAADYVARVEGVLDRLLPPADVPPLELHAAMRYAVLGGGKRIRPLLVYATGEVIGAPPERLDAAAAALELVHAFSLVHDDLPAMDDDDLRRGRATVHKAFDEATAILVGDALQVQAFHALAADPALRAHPVCQLSVIERLAEACGSRGMTGGQAIDLASEGKTMTVAELEQMHTYKTGYLIRAAVLMACHSTPDVPAATIELLDRFAAAIGLAFQVRDDILDVEGETEVIGKPQGADEARGKATYPALFGMAAARERADALYDEAMRCLSALDSNTAPLRWLSAYVVRRES